MKTRISILLLLIAVSFLIAGTALAQTHSPQSSSIYLLQSGSPSGGRYHLTSSVWQASGMSTGGHYQLVNPIGPMLTGNGCCCTYLPCTLRNP